METTEKNRFSILLEQLINTGEVKNASLAAALRYDASYISKWITGRMIPAEKTKRKVLRGISQEIVRQSTQSGLENLCADYQMLSMNKRWYIGHMTECFLPDELFEELLVHATKEMNLEMDVTQLRYLHALTRKTLEESHIRVIIYEDALSDLVVGRTISFFGCRLKLSLSQIQTYLKCLQHTCLKHLNLEVKLAIGKFVKDYQYEMTQCIFISDSISYLRLNTENRENNLALFNHLDMTEIFGRFFDEVWESSDGKCLSESTEIKHFFDHMIQSTEIQSGISFSF